MRMSASESRPFGTARPADPAIEYLKRLGVTAVELMPVHAFVDE
jgi:pullulanase/glycogen debranching enzyme